MFWTQPLSCALVCLSDLIACSPVQRLIWKEIGKITSTSVGFLLNQIFSQITKGRNSCLILIRLTIKLRENLRKSWGKWNTGNQNSILGSDVHLFCTWMVYLTLHFALTSQPWKWAHLHALCRKAFWRSLVLGTEEPEANVDPKGAQSTACTVTSLPICKPTNTPGYACPPRKTANAWETRLLLLVHMSFPIPLAPKVDLCHRECSVPKMALCFF